MTHVLKITTEDDKLLNHITTIKEFTIDGQKQIVSSSSLDLFDSSISITYYEAVKVVDGCPLKDEQTYD